MKIIHRIQSMSKIALTAEENAKFLSFIETFEKQCFKSLPNVVNNSIKPSISYEEVLLCNGNSEETMDKAYRHIPSSFITRCKIKD